MPRVATLTFTHTRDNDVAYHVFKHADRYADASFWCIESKDAGMVAPPNVEVLVRDFPRRGNLNGRECVDAMAAVGLEILDRGFDVIVKADSDACVLDFGWARSPLPDDRPRLAGIRLTAGVSGACYRYNRPAAEAVRRYCRPENYIPLSVPGRANEPEDLTFHAAVNAASGVVDVLPASRMTWWNDKAMAWPVQIPDCHVLYLCNGKAVYRDLIELAYAGDAAWRS